MREENEAIKYVELGLNQGLCVFNRGHSSASKGWAPRPVSFPVVREEGLSLIRYTEF